MFGRIRTAPTVGTQAALTLGVRKLEARGDSLLVCNQVRHYGKLWQGTMVGLCAMFQCFDQ